MKLLKYVMTSDTGLAPNPFFDVCSLALCTPNHMNAQLEVGDWIVGHSCKDTGRKLVYVMQVTRVLDMSTYSAEYPQKIPKINGSAEERCGDNLYSCHGGRWMRMPSACHNNAKSFRQDVGRSVFLAEGTEKFWYFGAANKSPLLAHFVDRFPWLIQDRQGFRYVKDRMKIDDFADWLMSLNQNGLIGRPRDSEPAFDHRYLVAVEPVEHWVPHAEVVAQSDSAIGMPPLDGKRGRNNRCC